MKKYKTLFLIITLSLGFYSCDQEVYTGPEEEEFISTAGIFVDSYPREFMIYLDGQISGFVTPDTLKFLMPGSHQITLRKYLYQDTSIVVGLNDEETESLFVDVLSNPINRGTIECSSSPDNAEIIINDSATGLLTPTILSNLLPGQYNIQYELSGHRGRNKTVTVSARSWQSVYFALDDTTTWVKYTTSVSNIAGNTVSRIAVDDDNTIWVGTDDKGISHYDRENWTTYNSSNSILSSNKINAVTIGNNIVYVGLPNSLALFNGSSWMEYSITGYTDGTISDLLVDNNGVLWIATSRGLITFNGSAFDYFSQTDTGFQNDDFTSLAIDINGDVWIGIRQVFGTDTYIGGGIAKYDGVSFTHYDSSIWGSEFDNSISKIKVGPDGTKWIGHLRNLDMNEMGGLSSYDGNAWNEVNFQLNDIVTNQPRINSIFVDANNTKWGGTTHFGLFRFNTPEGPKEFFNNGNSGLIGNKIIDIVEDHDGNLWLAVSGAGIVKLKVDKL